MKESQSQSDYFVEKIVKHKMNKSKPIFLVKWEGQDESNNSWEGLQNFTLNNLIYEYCNKHHLTKQLREVFKLEQTLFDKKQLATQKINLLKNKLDTKKNDNISDKLKNDNLMSIFKNKQNNALKSKTASFNNNKNNKSQQYLQKVSKNKTNHYIPNLTKQQDDQNTINKTTKEKQPNKYSKIDPTIKSEIEISDDSNSESEFKFKYSSMTNNQLSENELKRKRSKNIDLFKPDKIRTAISRFGSMNDIPNVIQKKNSISNQNENNNDVKQSQSDQSFYITGRCENFYNCVLNGRFVKNRGDQIIEHYPDQLLDWQEEKEKIRDKIYNEVDLEHYQHLFTNQQDIIHKKIKIINLVEILEFDDRQVMVKTIIKRENKEEEEEVLIQQAFLKDQCIKRLAQIQHDLQTIKMNELI